MVVLGVVPGVVEFGELGFSFVGAGVGATVPEGGDTVPGAGVAVPGVVVCPGFVVCPGVVCPGEVCAAPDPAAVPAPPVDPAVCSAAITTGAVLCAVGPGFDGELDGDDEGVVPVVHWSATLVALVTLNSFPVLAVADPAPIPALAVAELPEVDAAAFGPEVGAPVPCCGVDAFAEFIPPGCPVTCTSLPISVRTASRFPVNLYALPDWSVSV